jgi:acetyltransferase-like isoleucine patch superfamily enzyme
MKIILLKIGYILTANLSIFFSTIRFRWFIFLVSGHCGKNAKIDGKVFVRTQSPGTIQIGNNFTLNSRPGSNLVGVTNFASFQSLGTGKIQIGDNCGLTSTVLSSRASIKIGNNVKIGGNTRIYDHDYHSLNYSERRDSISDSEGCKTAAVEICDDVFIGANATILKGVRIGARSVIGTGSVVSLKNIPEDSIVAGNPARLIQKN